MINPQTPDVPTLRDAIAAWREEFDTVNEAVWLAILPAQVATLLAEGSGRTAAYHEVEGCAGRYDCDIRLYRSQGGHHFRQELGGPGLPWHGNALYLTPEEALHLFSQLASSRMPLEEAFPLLFADVHKVAFKDSTAWNTLLAVLQEACTPQPFGHRSQLLHLATQIQEAFDRLGRQMLMAKVAELPYLGERNEAP